MRDKPFDHIMVTGAAGQIGSELVMALRERYGSDNVVAVGHRSEPSDEVRSSGPFHFADIRKRNEVEELVDRYRIDAIFNMAAILSAVGEKHPDLCWDVNVNGFQTVLNVARDRGLARVINPSSIAVFGPTTPRENTPQETVLMPTTMYGVTKVAGERLGDYYFHKYGVDVRGMRLPGIVSWKTPPGGGTTDYAVAIYYDAIEKGSYTCFVSESTVLPMMYMPDCIKCFIELAEAPLDNLVHHCDFNVTSMSFSAEELAAAIQARIPDFRVTYEPDFRQAIADSWPRSIDDGAARREWGWKPDYDLERMTDDMLANLRVKLGRN